jgi:MFS family permease
VTTTIAGAPPATSGSRYWPGVVAAALTATVMPGFTVGALAPAIEQELQVSGTTVGLMISAFYAAAAVVACTVMLVVSQADDLVTMAAVLVAGGLSNGLVQPAAGRLIAARVPGRRRSSAAGAVGAALGAGTLVPGLLVALVVPGHGWRTAMVIAGLICLIPVTVTPPTTHQGPG